MTARPFLAPLFAVLAGAAAVSACGSEPASAPATTTSSVPVTLAPSTTEAMPASVDFDLVVGENSGRDTLVEVRVGTTVTLRVTAADAIDEVHIHGYDLYLEDLTAGTTASITFVADVDGEFEVERHDTGEVLMMLRVR